MSYAKAIKHIRTLGWQAPLSIMVKGVSFANSTDDFLRSQYQRPDTIPFPFENPYTPGKATLGKMLFLHTRLSRDQNKATIAHYMSGRIQRPSLAP